MLLVSSGAFEHGMMEAAHIPPHTHPKPEVVTVQKRRATRDLSADLHPVQVTTAKDLPFLLLDAIVCLWCC